MLNNLEEPKTAPPAIDNSDAGYGKPPAAHQFKPGQSGNLKGRPTGSKNKVPAFGVEQLKSTVLAELYREIEVVDGAERVTIPVATAIIQKIAEKAAAGDLRAGQMIIAMGQNIERENRMHLEENLQIVSNYKRYCEKEENFYKSIGRTRPNELPHHEHVDVNVEGDVEISGPLDQEEQLRWNKEHSMAQNENSFPKRVLVRSRDFPAHNLNGEVFVRKSTVGSGTVAAELPSVEFQKPDVIHPKVEVKKIDPAAAPPSVASALDIALDPILRGNLAPLSTQKMISKLKSHPYFE